MTGDAHEYSSADITVLEFDASVRKRPGMFFGVGPDNPALATRVLDTLLRHALHPAPSVAPDHVPRVVAEIGADLAFSVADDQADALTDEGVPRDGYHGSLLTFDRWAFAAAAALSVRVTVDVWRDGRGLRQRLAGLRPVEAPVEFAAGAGCGTRVAYLLDAGYLGSSAAVTADLSVIDVHGPYCALPTGPGFAVVRDLRDSNGPTERRFD